MNNRDLLNAFQYIDECYVREARQREDEPFRDTQEDFIMKNTVTRRMIACAAAVAVCSIAAVSVIAIRQRKSLVADSPESAAMIVQNGAETTQPHSDALTAVQSTAKDTAQTTMETTVSALPIYDDIAIVTEPAVTEEPEVPVYQIVLFNRVMAIYAPEDHIENADSLKDTVPLFSDEQSPAMERYCRLQDHTYLYDGTEPVKWNIHGILNVSQSSENPIPFYDLSSIKMRIMLVENGEFLPFSTSNGEKDVLYADFDFPMNSGDPGSAVISFHPKGTADLESVSVVCTPAPEILLDQRYYPLVPNFYLPGSIRVAHPSGDQTISAYTAQDSDYLAFPDDVRHEAEVLHNGDMRYNSSFGVGIGKKMDYDSGDSERLQILAGYNLNYPAELKRDEVYLKVNADDAAELHRVMVLCDSKPLRIQGKDSIAFDCLNGSRTLNYRLDLSDIPDGTHYFEVLLLHDDGSAGDNTPTTQFYRNYGNTRYLVNISS